MTIELTDAEAGQLLAALWARRGVLGYGHPDRGVVDGLIVKISQGRRAELYPLPEEKKAGEFQHGSGL